VIRKLFGTPFSGALPIPEEEDEQELESRESVDEVEPRLVGVEPR
jgi:hypothetical protein